MYLFWVHLLSVAVFIPLSFENQIKDGVKCSCMKSIRCKYWVSAVSRGKYLDLPVCGYDHHTLSPLLCCPRDDVDWTSKANRSKREIQSLQGLDNLQLSCTVTSHNLASPAKIANQKCVEYAESIFQNVYEVSEGDSPLRPTKVDTCNKKDDKNAETAEPREFPHMALIGYGDEESTSWRCGGSLISERFILSTARCSNTRIGEAKWAKLGDLDISTDDDPTNPQIYKISKRIIHPEFQSSLFYHDIALFKLDRDATFTLYVRPACIFTKRDPPDNEAEATGWGPKTSAVGSSKTLKKVKMDLVSIDECIEAYSSLNLPSAGIPQGIQADSMTCAKLAAEATIHVSQGDGGGPLQIPLKKPYCMDGIIGLTSFGPKFGSSIPDVFTRVTHYVPWIVQNVWSDD